MRIESVRRVERDCFMVRFIQQSTHAHLIDLDVAKRITLDFLAVSFHLLDDCVDAGALTQEDVDVADSVHHCLEAFAFFGEINVHLGDENSVYIECLGGFCSATARCLGYTGTVTLSCCVMQSKANELANSHVTTFLDV